MSISRFLKIFLRKLSGNSWILPKPAAKPLQYSHSCSTRRNYICVSATEFPMQYHTNLPCLRLYWLRQSSLALKAHCAFNPEQARRSELLSCAQCYTQAGRRARSTQPNTYKTQQQTLNKKPLDELTPRGFKLAIAKNDCLYDYYLTCDERDRSESSSA